MRPLTDRIPKPLLSVAGEPLVVHILRALARAGIVEAIVNVSHLADRIEQALGTGAAYGVRIAYSREPVPLETAGGIALALNLLGEEPFVVVNADICTDFDFAQLAAHALPAAAASPVAHLVLVDNPPHHPDGDFALIGRRVSEEGAPRLTFAGIGVYRPALFAGVAPGTRAQLAPLLRQAMARGEVTGVHHRGLWMDVGTPERLAASDRALRAALGDEVASAAPRSRL